MSIKSRIRWTRTISRGTPDDSLAAESCSTTHWLEMASKWADAPYAFHIEARTSRVWGRYANHDIVPCCLCCLYAYSMAQVLFWIHYFEIKFKKLWSKQTPPTPHFQFQSQWPLWHYKLNWRSTEVFSSLTSNVFSILFFLMRLLIAG